MDVMQPFLMLKYDSQSMVFSVIMPGWPKYLRITIHAILDSPMDLLETKDLWL